MSHSQQNKIAYDALADEYEDRAGSLLPITEEAMEYFGAYLPLRAHVLDIGCAVGIAMHVLTQKGFTASGIEISPQMAEYATKRNPRSNVIVGDFMTSTFNERYDGILAFAFIHLFPKAEVVEIFAKMHELLRPGGVALLSSTESAESKEGWFVKEDFNKKEKRFRKFWTERELEESFSGAGFKKLALKKFTDPYGKTWMDFIVERV